MTAIDARERECPVLPCVPFTTVNADLVTAEDVLAPAPAEARPERLGLALVVISTAQLMVVLDATIVTVALPSIQRALHFSTADLQWVLSAYTLTFGGLLLFGGRLGDVLGRRRMFVVGLLLFAGASLAGGLATTSVFLVAARAVQGCGAAIAAPTALSLIGDTFEEGPARTRAMGVYAAMSGAGSAIGLLVGGLLTDVASWRWVFFINVPIGAAVALAAPRVLPKSVGRGGHLDVPGAITVTAATTALVYGLIRAPSDGWADAITIACLVGAALLYAVFVLVEANSTSPLLPFRLFANRNRAAAYVVMLCTAAAIFAVFFFLTQILQNAFGYSPIVAGLAFLPFSLGIAATSEFVAKFLERVGPRVFASVGPFLCALGLVWLSRIGVHSTYGRDILGPTLLLSIGLGCTFVPLTLAATSRVASTDLGIASALLNSAQEIGGTIGLAVLVTVAATVTRNWLTSHVTSAPARTLALNSALHGYRAAFLVGAAIATVGGFVALVGRSELRNRTPKEPLEPDMPDPNDWNASTIAEFRANDGRVGGPFEGATLTLLHHRGRKSGREFVTPVMYLVDERDDNTIYVFATKGGAPANPDWYYNLLESGEGTIERGTEMYEVKVREIRNDERDRIYDKQARLYPGFAEYAEKTRGIRTIPVLALSRA